MELRHTGNLKIFSENASTNESSAFGTTTNTDDINTLLNTNFQVGWENGIDEDGFPLRKWFNGKDKAITKLIAYLFQQGTPKYDSSQKYYVDSVCVYSGKVYISLVGTEATPNVGNTPSSSIGTSWNILNMNHLTGAISNILTSNLTENRALISDSSGKITISGVTATILNYLANVSSDIQTQLNGKTPLDGSGANGTWGISITGVADNLITPSGTYKHVGAWGIDGIGVAGAILVNSAYRAERCQDLSNHEWDSKAQSGYIRLSTGLIIQWGLFVQTGANTYVNTPVAFPNSFLHIMTSLVSASVSAPGASIINNNTFNSNRDAAVANQYLYYIAIGW